MAGGTELGKAYVQVVPSTEGIASKLEKEFSSAGTNSGHQFGLGFGAAIGASSAITSKLIDVAGQAVTAAVDFINDSVSNYADYEQLTGGVEKLFGDSADTIEEYAQNAYQTAGMSANDYMETITGFSASLISSLNNDTAQAAEIGNMAVEDMADNANTFGTNIQDIQNAYQGFAKQNWTMLDNLRLGYGGNKAEMERLITDAEKLDKSFKATRDENDDLTLSFADVANAIHIVQDSMNITGTTAREASETISGSAASTQAAWENLQTTMADKNGDTKKAVNTWLDAFKTSASNTFESIKATIENIPEALEVILPEVGSLLEDLWNEYGTSSEIIRDVNKMVKEHNELIEDSTESLWENLDPIYEAKAQWEAFKGLIDDNGKISKEHLGEAKILLNEINEYLGEDETLQQRINEATGEQANQIDKVLEKQQAEAEMQAVLAMEESAMDELTEATNKYNEAQERVQYCQEQINNMDPRSTEEKATLAQELLEAQTAMDSYADIIQSDKEILKIAYDDEAYYREEAYDKIVAYDMESIRSAENRTDAVKEQLEQSIENERIAIDSLRDIRDKANKNDINAQINTYKALIEEQKTQLQTMIDTEKAKNEAIKEDTDKTMSELPGIVGSYGNATKESAQEIGDTISYGVNNTDFAPLSNNFSGTMDGMVGKSGTAANQINDNLAGIKDKTVQIHLSASQIGYTVPEKLTPGTTNVVTPYALDPIYFAKGYDKAMMLSAPTIFGMAGNNLLVGGDKPGNEVVVGEEHLLNMIGSVTDRGNNEIIQLLSALVSGINQLINKDQDIYVDSKRVAKLLAKPITNELNTRTARANRKAGIN